MKREEAMKLVENGIAKLNEALQSGRSETLERFLATLARFHNYSFGNAILIWSQKPEATQVAGFHAWRKFGRCVKKGEHGIAILAPMVSRKDREHGVSDRGGDKSGLIFGFRVAYVFDVTQTDGEPLPEFADASGDPGDWLSRLEQSIRESGIVLEYDFVPHGALGCSMPGKIIVRPDYKSRLLQPLEPTTGICQFAVPKVVGQLPLAEEPHLPRSSTTTGANSGGRSDGSGCRQSVKSWQDRPVSCTNNRTARVARRLQRHRTRPEGRLA